MDAGSAAAAGERLALIALQREIHWDPRASSRRMPIRGADSSCCHYASAGKDRTRLLRSQSALKIRYERVRAAEHAPRGPLRLLERPPLPRGHHRAQRRRLCRAPTKPPHPEREIIILSKNVLRRGYRFGISDLIPPSPPL